MPRSSAAIDAALSDPPHGTIVVAFSGGLDSTVLLHALTMHAAVGASNLRAIHVDHRLHAASADWAQHCRATCETLGVQIDIVDVQIDSPGDGPEAAARRARWLAFGEHVDSINEVLALAHHRDDQAETVLLRLMRGAGPAGLAAMRPLSTRDDGLRVWRPLLGVERADLATMARDHGLRWIDDPSNTDTVFDRNYLRHAVLPALRARWPQVGSILARVADRQADMHAIERERATILLAQAATPDPDVLAIPPLRNAPRAQRWAALRLWLSHRGARDVGAARLARIDEELLVANDDADPRIALGDCVLRRYRDRLHALQPAADMPVDYRLTWDGLEPLTLPQHVGTLVIQPAPREALALIASSRQGGERLRMHPNGPRREMKHLLQDAGVPTWQRARWPVLSLDGETAAFADIIVGDSLQARLASMGARLRFDPH